MLAARKIEQEDAPKCHGTDEEPQGQKEMDKRYEASRISVRMRRMQVLRVRVWLPFACAFAIVLWTCTRYHVWGDGSRVVRRSDASVCSLVKRMAPGVSADKAIMALLASAPVGSPALVLDVGLAHGKECFAIAESGHICRGFEADPEYARIVKEKAATHPQAHRLQIHSAAVGAVNSHVLFHADRHNAHGVAGFVGELTFPPNATKGTAERERLEEGWQHVKVPLVRLDSTVAPEEHVWLLKTDTQGHEFDVLKGAAGLFRERRVRFLIVESSIRLLPGDTAERERALRQGRSPPEARLLAQREEMTLMVEFLEAHDFACCDLAWHDEAGKRREANLHQSNVPTGLRQPTEASEWSASLAAITVAGQASRSYFTDLLCELRSAV